MWRAVQAKESQGEPERVTPAELDVRAQSEERARPAIRCAACGRHVTESEARIEMAGSHVHTCMNPGGYVYRIGCFSAACGCVGVGQWSGVHSWFAGYCWQITCCAGCSMHLGWAFEPEQPGTSHAARFYGLILERLIEPSDASAAA